MTRRFWIDIHFYLVHEIKMAVKSALKRRLPMDILGEPEVKANLYCNFANLYWEGYVICSIYLR